MADYQTNATNGRLGAHISWARTPNRTERTAPATNASPVSYGYWLRKITEEGVVRPQDREKAAENAHQGYMRGLAAKSKEARAAKKGSKRPTRNTRQTAA